MADRDWLLERFEAQHGHLRAVARRMLGSTAEADDAIREVERRLAGIDPSPAEDLRAWMTIVVGRVSLEKIGARATSGDAPEPLRLGAAIRPDKDVADPAAMEAMLGDVVTLALLAALEAMAPAERLVFALHEIFGLSTDEVGTIVGRSPTSARRLARRARGKIRETVPGRHTSSGRRV